jgi:RNA polymerase sigma-70 factor (ECF subfamily)
MDAGSDANVTQHLLSRFRQGDGEALGRLYGRYFDRLQTVVHARIGPRLRSKLESTDVVQEAFLASLRGLGTFEYTGEGAFFHFLCKLAENRIRDLADHYAAQKRDGRRERPLELRTPSAESVYGPLNELATFTTPATKAARREEVNRLLGAIDALPDQQREALILTRYEDLSFNDAACAMGKTPDAVRMLVARAIVALGKKLGVVSS